MSTGKIERLITQLQDAVLQESNSLYAQGDVAVLLFTEGGEDAIALAAERVGISKRFLMYRMKVAQFHPAPRRADIPWHSVLVLTTQARGLQILESLNTEYEGKKVTARIVGEAMAAAGAEFGSSNAGRPSLPEHMLVIRHAVRILTSEGVAVVEEALQSPTTADVKALTASIRQIKDQVISEAKERVAALTQLKTLTKENLQK